MPDLDDDALSGYTFSEQNGRFEVRAASGRVVMVCRDAQSAAHYASLLNQAYRAGYKAGYKGARGK